MNPCIKAILTSIPAGVAIGILLSLGARSEPMPAPKPEMPVCKIIIPHLYLESGWKFWDPSQNGTISDLVRDGKAETVELPGQAECTRYGVNQTPVTTPSALAMWRRI